MARRTVIALSGAPASPAALQNATRHPAGTREARVMRSTAGKATRVPIPFTSRFTHILLIQSGKGVHSGVSSGGGRLQGGSGVAGRVQVAGQRRSGRPVRRWGGSGGWKQPDGGEWAVRRVAWVGSWERKHMACGVGARSGAAHQHTRGWMPRVRRYRSCWRGGEA